MMASPAHERAFRGNQCAQHGGNEGGPHAMTHHITNDNSCFLIGNAHDVKEIAPDQAGRLIEMRKAQPGGLGCSVGGKDWIILWHKSLL